MVIRADVTSPSGPISAVNGNVCNYFLYNIYLKCLPMDNNLGIADLYEQINV